MTFHMAGIRTGTDGTLTGTSVCGAAYTTTDGMIHGIMEAGMTHGTTEDGTTLGITAMGTADGMILSTVT